MRISTETEINIEKKHNEKTLLDLSKTKHENRELQKKVQSLENKLQLKDKEIEDLEKRLEMRNAIEQKQHNRDSTLFQKIVGKAPTGTSTYDAKMMSLIKEHQDIKESLEEENHNLKKEVDRLASRLAIVEEENTKIKKELNQNYDKLTREANKVAISENENITLIKDNQALRERLEKLDNELNEFREENYELQRKNDDLRTRYFTGGDLATPSKVERGSVDNLTPQGNIAKPTKSFSTSKKPDLRESERSANLLMVRPQLSGTDLGLNESRQLISEVRIFISFSKEIMKDYGDL